jgi:hypothetical protein
MLQNALIIICTLAGIWAIGTLISGFVDLFRKTPGQKPQNEVKGDGGQFPCLGCLCILLVIALFLALRH